MIIIIFILVFLILLLSIFILYCLKELKKYKKRYNKISDILKFSDDQEPYYSENDKYNSIINLYDYFYKEDKHVKR